MSKRHVKPLSVLRDEVQQYYFKTCEDYYGSKQSENKVTLLENSEKVMKIFQENESHLTKFPKFQNDPYPEIESLYVSKGRCSTGSGSPKSPKEKKPTAKIDLNIQDSLSASHRKKRYEKRQAASVPIQNQIPRYAFWTPIIRSSKTEDDPVLRHLYYFGEDSEDDGDIDYSDVYEDSIVGRNSIDPEGEQIAMRTLHHIFNQNNVSVGLVEKSLVKIDPKQSEVITTSSRMGRSSVTANRAIEIDDHDVEIVEVVANALAKILKGKEITMLLHKYLEYARKFEPPSSATESTSTPDDSSDMDIESPKSESNVNLMMHSYSSLWCRRCYVYDCKLHGTDFRPSENRKRPRPPNDKNKPCGVDCYMHLKREARSPYDKWNDVEIALFRKAALLIGSKNYCQIADIIPSKNCKQVYRRSRALGEVEKEQEVEIGSSSDEAKKKSRKIMTKIVIDAENHSEYHPCDHPGRPCDFNCPCKKGNVPCEKYCHCDLDCPRRFPGCNCYGFGKTCSNRGCICFTNYRECDPDLCGCTASECNTSHSVSETDMGRSLCKNVAIQRRQAKHTIVGISTVAGWGLFVREHVKKNEYLGEYIGEVISQTEADRRGKIYDKRRTSFLFNLNKEFVVDATRKGNKFRFINHSQDPNAYCRVTLVKGEHRIGIYALCDLEPGSELFFDYRYDGEALKFVPNERELAASPVKSISNGK
ncbi:unnamed protein product [Rhizophagus irregularis]|uniref:[histone H3]-lysine(27) N-trimethyltransferase n=1 Tax=Rhizophagus irregularis TaxID=588596 RepID=A0A2I1GF26_9GLOM|nr:SET domain-containing protein [Rhizophagus irregularis]CAB4432133.1 unnamed protein product [Rhizophagus irregularis]